MEMVHVPIFIVKKGEGIVAGILSIYSSVLILCIYMNTYIFLSSASREVSSAVASCTAKGPHLYCFY